MFLLEQVQFKHILDIKHLEIQSKKITGIIGPSGSGKSTLLKLLNKMYTPTSGNIFYNGVNMKELDAVDHRRKVTMLSQSPVMYDDTVRVNLNMALKFQGKEIASDEKLNDILLKVGLTSTDLDFEANKLSGGEKQRISLGRILLTDPEVFLLDEPSSALDDETEDFIIQMIVSYVREKDKTLVMVTHSKDVAENYTDTIIKIGA